MMNNDSLSKVAGVGVAELKVPAWIKVIKSLYIFSVWFFLTPLVLWLGGWNWVMSSNSEEKLIDQLALGTAGFITLASALCLILYFGRPLNRLLGIKKKDGRWVFTNFGTPGKPALSMILLAILFGLSAVLFSKAVDSCPLPKKMAQQKIKITPPTKSETLSPIYFWDYATWIESSFFENAQLLLPYEKGPPQKLLSKVYFEDAHTHEVLLELHGKRPRTYSPQAVDELFSSVILKPRDWPLTWRLQKEAGFTATQQNPPPFLRVTLDQDTKNSTVVIGPAELDAGFPFKRAFFFGPEGTVFQFKCAAPCTMKRTLELVQFPEDPKGSLQERLIWTTGTLRNLLLKSPPKDPRERLRHENMLSFYLVSLLTLDPRDPEAFFHIGKLARNRETVLSAIRYGKDLGLEAAKIAELESVLQQIK